MKRHTLVNSLFSSKALLILASVAVPTFAHAAQTDISNTPLATGVSAAVKPNILYVLDDSGSMADDFMPDEVINSGSCKRSRSSSADNTGATTCRQGEPPYYAAEYNGLYYDPQIAYLPGLNADGTSKASFGSPWTAVKVNAYTSASTINLTNSYPEIVLCNSNGADVNDSTQCKRNGINGTDPNGHGAYAFPNNTVGAPVVHYNSYGVGVNKITAGTFAIRKTRNANPFYYTITPSEFCNSSKLTVCVASALPTGAFTFPAQLRFCSSNAARSKSVV